MTLAGTTTTLVDRGIDAAFTAHDVDRTGTGPGDDVGSIPATDLDRALGLLATAERATAEAGLLLGGIAGSGLAQWLGYVSLERLVAHRTGCGNRSAAGLLRVARFLNDHAVTGAAVRSGRLLWAKADVLARAAAGLGSAYRRDEAELIGFAEAHEVEELERVCRVWRTRADAEAAHEDAERRFRRRGVWLQFAFDGSCRGRLHLDADAAEIVAAALDTSPDPTGSLAEPRSLAQRRADALVDLCHDFLHGDTNDEADDTASRSGTRTTFDVVIDINTLAGTGGPIDRIVAEFDHGGPITGPGLERLLCDASFRALITDGPHQILAYNRATPDIPPALRRAVRLRDRRCVFRGCDRHWQWCDLHHLTLRHRGGPTSLDNLAAVCRFHHRLVHEGGWQLTRAPDGQIVTTSP